MKQRIIKAVLMAAAAAFVLTIYLSSRAPAESLISPYYLANALADTGAGNIVAAIYLNYRMYDSLFETLMLIVSVTAVIKLSWRSPHES